MEDVRTFDAESAKHMEQKAIENGLLEKAEANAENIIEYIKEQMINDILVELITRRNNYSSKASGRPLSAVIRMDYENSMRIVSKLKNTQYQLNSGNPISTYQEYENAYNDAINLIYATENSGEFRVNRANDTAIGIHRK